MYSSDGFLKKLLKSLQDDWSGQSVLTKLNTHSFWCDNHSMRQIAVLIFQFKLI